jgi:hypothetical protein
MCRNVKYEFIKGSIFNTDRFKLELVVIFVPCGLTSLRYGSKYFILNNGEFLKKIKNFKLFKNKSLKNKHLQNIILDENIDNELYSEFTLHEFVDTILNLSSNLGVKSLGMNGVRLQNPEWRGSGEPERILIESVNKWINNNKESSIEKVVFIDKRGGFNKCTKSIQ